MFNKIDANRHAVIANQLRTLTQSRQTALERQMPYSLSSFIRGKPERFLSKII